MSAANPRYYKWYPTEKTDLGTMPFEGDWTQDDTITTLNVVSGMQINFFYGTDYETGEKGFGRTVSKKVGNRVRNVFVVGGLIFTPAYIEIDGQQVQVPVWFRYCGDGVCTVKLPNGEQPEPVEV